MNEKPNKGRPSTPRGRSGTSITVRVSHDEKAQISEAARRAEVTPAEYMRTFALAASRPLPKPHPESCNCDHCTW